MGSRPWSPPWPRSHSGNFTELPVIAASAVALGILQQGVAWNDPTNPALGLAVLAGVVFAAIVVRQLFGHRGDRESESTLSLAGSVRDLSVSARARTEVRVGTPVGGLIAFAAACTLPLWMGPGELIRASALVVLAMVGCSVVVLTGWSGQVSLGQMSFAAVGAVVGTVALVDWHWDLSLALLLSAAAAAAAAVVVGIPTLRLDGMFAAVTTLAFALVASGYLLVPAEFSWIPQGQLGVPYLFGIAVTSQGAVFELCLCVLVLVLVALYGLRHSRTGRVLRALPANQRAASGYGVRVVPAKLTAFAVSGFIAGLAGCLFVVVNQQYDDTAFLVPGEPRGVHLDRRRGVGVGLRSHPRRRHRRGQQRLPAAELAALPLRPRRAHRARCSSPVAWRGSVTTCVTGPSTRLEHRRADAGARHRPRGRSGDAVKRLASLGAGASLFPLTILFSIELLDQATQSAFNVLTPNVRDAFHLTNAGILLIVAIAGAAALAFTLPVAVLADRTNRVRIALIGAIVGAAFSIALGAARRWWWPP